MADRGFKIKENLMMSMATLCIPPSCTASMQMLPSDVRKTSNIANVRIYVEQAIGRVKRFHILKNELPITLLPLVDDIVRVCCALCNLHPPLCELSFVSSLQIFISFSMVSIFSRRVPSTLLR